jgi:hypothetical protein
MRSANVHPVIIRGLFGFGAAATARYGAPTGWLASGDETRST